MFIDDNLKHFTHLKYINTYLKQQTGILRSIGKFLNLQGSIMYYYAYIFSKVNYGINAWGGVLIASNYSNCIVKSQNKIMRILFGSFFGQNCDVIYHKLNILKVRDMYKFNISTVMFNVIEKSMTPFIYERLTSLFFTHDYNTRGSRHKVPICDSPMVKFNFIYRVIIEYNKLPNEILNSENIRTFKKGLKAFFMNAYI